MHMLGNVMGLAIEQIICILTNTLKRNVMLEYCHFVFQCINVIFFFLSSITYGQDHSAEIACSHTEHDLQLTLIKNL